MYNINISIYINVYYYFCITGIGDDRSNNLKKAKLVTMPLKECNISYVTRSKTIVETQICAGSNKSDACLVRIRHNIR